MAVRRFPSHHLFALALLISAGAAGNYFSIPLFFGADFLFGSIATLLILRFYGVWWGVLGALLINAYTYVLWGHSLGLVLFTLEAVVVGLLFRRWPHTSFLLLDSLFWILLGIPLNWMALQEVIGLDSTGVMLITLKQSVNGLFNAIIAVLALTHLPLHRWLPDSDRRHRISIGEGFFNLLVTFLMVPALALTIQSSRHELRRINQEVGSILAAESKHVSSYVYLWRERYLRRIVEVGQVAADLEMTPSEGLASTLQFLLDTSPDFVQISILTPNGDIVAGLSRTGAPVDVADPINLNRVRHERTLVVSDVHTTPALPEAPVITVSHPIMKGGQLIGIAQAMLDPAYIHRMITRPSEVYPVYLTLVDSSGNVFGSSRPNIRPLQQFDPRAGSEVSWLSHGRYHRFPSGQPAALNRWRESEEVLETEVPGIGGWRLIAEVPLEPYRTRLYRTYIDSLLTVLGLMVAALLLSTLLSRWITGPLLRLTAITRYLPERLKGGEPIIWPSSSIAEVDSLSVDIRRMAVALRDRFDEIERDARQQQALLSATMEAADLPVVITDEERRIIYVNPPFLLEYGYAPDEVLGRRPCTLLQSPLSDGASVDRLHEALDAGVPATVTMIYQRKDGTLLDVEMSLSPVRDGTGRITHYVAILRNVSARKARERAGGQPEERQGSTSSRSPGSEETREACSVLVYAEHSIAERVRSILEPDIAQVDLFHRAQDAWAAVESECYAVALLDESMPGGGREFLARLRQSERYARLPVILIDPTREADKGWSRLSSGAWVIDGRDAARLKEAIRHTCGQL
ncbi:MAG: PAS domain-containing protein [Bacillota bacterium]